MADIAEIMDMIDWHMPSEIRIKGVSLARDTETIIPFIQPLTPEHNKNVWEGCAVIIAEKSDEDLKPYLVELLGWLQDMNWPGAFCILNRLQRYADNNSLRDAINICIEKDVYKRQPVCYFDFIRTLYRSRICRRLPCQILRTTGSRRTCSPQTRCSG